MPEVKQEKEGSANNYCKIVANTVSRKQYHAYLMDDICEPHNYVDLFNVLKSADHTDEVHLYINSPGGYLHTTMQIAMAVKICRAPVTGYLECQANSGAGMIFLACHKHVVYKHAMLMCHYYSGMSMGKGNEIKVHVDFVNKHHREVYMDLYRGFMAEKELMQVFEGKDFWFSYKEITKRLKTMHKIRGERESIGTTVEN